MSQIRSRNRQMFEQCKNLGDATYCEDKGLLIRANVGAERKDRWGFDVVQSSAWYAVALANWCRDHEDDCAEERRRLNRVMLAMCGSQDRRRDSDTYGNIFWRVGWTDVRDRNGVSFWSPEAGLVYHAYRDLLDLDVSAALSETLNLCVEGLDRHRPRWQYTNIFLLNILSRLTIAEATGREDVRAQAEEDWQTWYTETGSGGLTEYNSPTYIVTALVPLARMLDFTRDAGMCAEIETTLEYLYADFCWHYFEPSGGLAGAMSRAYPGDYLHNSLSNYIAHQQFGAPLTNISLSAPFVAASSYEAPARTLEAATTDKAGVTVRASIPDLGISRQTVFGHHFALGLKSGRSYGVQELPLTLAHRSPRQHLMFLHHESAVRAPIYSAATGTAALSVIDYPASDPESAPPHCWSKFILGPPDQFSRITVEGNPWDGGYVDLTSGRALSLITDHIAVSLRVGAFATQTHEHPTAKIFLWNQYETNQVVVECIAWEPTRVAFALAADDGAQPPDLGPVRTEGSDFSVELPDGTATVTVPAEADYAIPSDTPLLETPWITWRRGWVREEAV